MEELNVEAHRENLRPRDIVLDCGAAIVVGEHAVLTRSQSPAQFTYTPSHLLELASVGATTTRFGYDGDELRVKKQADGSRPVYYVRDAGGQLLEEWNSPNRRRGSLATCTKGRA